jgi:predicted transcriptional regulator
LTPGAAFSTLKTMEVHFTPELQAKLESLAAEDQRGADEYVQQLVESYVDHDAWVRQKVMASMGQLDRGEFLTHDEVGARLQKIFQP